MDVDDFYLSNQHYRKQPNPTLENPVLMLFDKHESRLSIQALNFCKKKGTNVSHPPPPLFSLPPISGRVNLWSFDMCCQRVLRFLASRKPGQGISLYEVEQFPKAPFI